MNSNETARQLRRRGTQAERILWLALRTKKLNGIKFRRQEPIGKYVVDFVSFERNLVIEIDGGQHSKDSIIESDGVRTEWLKSQGFQVLRFWNNDVVENLDGVIVKIQELINP